ncbi:interleukin 15, like [Polyodon spathula]|uniref:interleukin 15, like n=1 Tax=Polyodon spathula TaxID=7913 RepID=UPI001B7DDA43|nr:interleukin 15, like [Polyodon spathula]
MHPFPVPHRRTVPLLLSLVVIATQMSQGARCDPKWYEAIKEMKKVINDVIPKTNNSINCTLYTPDSSLVNNCMRTALGCFSDELHVMIFEFGDLQKAWTVTRMLTGIKERVVDTGACAQCETYQEKSVGVFLTNLLNFLQLLVSSDMLGT